MTTEQNTNSRIILVDAIRGFALLGIMLLHANEHFDLFWFADKNPEILRSVDPHVSRIIVFLFSGKAYSIFSLMFGFSFFIQMERAAKRGTDFTWRFLWRLTVLFIMGYLLSLMYSSQILVLYAVLGLPLVLFFRFNKKTLIILAVLFLLQIPTIISIVCTYTNPNFVLNQSFGNGLWGEAFNTFANGTFSDVVHFNSLKGHIAVWSWMYYNGRYLQLFGLFLIGLSLGKSHFFEDYINYKKPMIIVLLISVVSFAIFYTLLLKLPAFEMPQPRSGLYYTLLKSYTDLAFTSVYVSLIILVFQHLKKSSGTPLLASYGRMSLTNYIMQPLVGVPLFYGYGFALYHYLGATLSFFYGILFLAFQLWFSRMWLKHFYYGPFEWIWRAFTFFDFGIKFKKSKTDKVSRNNT